MAGMLLVLLLPALPLAAQEGTPDGFADLAFAALWTRADLPVAQGIANRSWTWGAQPGAWRYERYLGAPEDVRLVQYFDKSRMEINDPTGDRSSPWFVTNGLLVFELISGQVQTDIATYEQRKPADIPIAGDPIDNPLAPTYAMLGRIASLYEPSMAAPLVGMYVENTYSPQGIGIGIRDDLKLPASQIVRYDETMGHNIPRAFDEFMRQVGLVSVDGQLVREQIVDPLYTFGHPVTEPYWAQVTIGGEPRPVLFQAYQRRILTYTPDNPDPWKVEMGNVGQHYYRWRYGEELRYAQPPLAEGVRVRETTIALPTYAYEQALVPTAPDDPIYPYQRLDRERVGPPQPRDYRAVVLENRFLELTMLPELGGRLYRAVPRATGHNLFYANPVVKPSVFGQRGWWLGVGGLEWAAPTQEHGYLEHLPWELTTREQDGGRVARVAMTEQQSGMQVVGEVGLQPDAGTFSVQMQVTNDTPAAHPLQMWTNAMLTPGAANHTGEGLHFLMPTEQVIIHAAEETQAPAPGELMPWPTLEGRDMSYPAAWDGYLGAFAPQPLPFLGVYDTQRDEGAAVLHGPETVGGKVFAFSEHFNRDYYTDDGSDYVELWSGAQPTFWDNPPLEPGATRSISAVWLPLWGIGDLAVASEAGALGLSQRPDGGSTVTLAVARSIPGAEVVVRLDGAEVFRSAPLDLRPDLPLPLDLPRDVRGRALEVEAPGLLLRVP
jgi:hypothetical protein